MWDDNKNEEEHLEMLCKMAGYPRISRKGDWFRTSPNTEGSKQCIEFQDCSLQVAVDMIPWNGEIGPVIKSMVQDMNGKPAVLICIPPYGKPDAEHCIYVPIMTPDNVWAAFSATGAVNREG